MRVKATVRTITGKTRHLLGAEDRAQSIASLQIEAADDAFYLLYFDSADNYITDTWHQSIDEAKRQANFEFEVLDGDWVEIE